MDQRNFTRLCKSICEEVDAVTSIEYALLASLIAVVITVAIGLVGTNAQALFGLVSNCVNFAVFGAGSCA